MLPPHELKNKEFTKAMRGYLTTEVDEHIGFMIEKYTELYTENDKLERKLRTVLAQLDAYKSEEESIRSALINAQKASAGIIDEANEKAEMIVRSAKNNCDRILSELRDKITKEQETLETLKRCAADFKDRLFTDYQEQIDLIERVAPESELQPEDGDYRQSIVDGIKNDINDVIENGAYMPDEDGEVPERMPESEAFPGEIADEPFGAESPLTKDGVLEEADREIAEDTVEIAPEEIADGSAFEDDDGISEDDAKTVTFDRSRIVGSERIGSIRDSVRALNRTFTEENTKKTDTAPSDDTDSTDREFLQMIQNATGGSQKRAETKANNENDSGTSEFERVYGKNR